MASTYGLLVGVNQTVIDQADFFDSDGYTRLTGLATSDVTIQVFFNNSLVPWSTLDGTAVSDSQVASGSVYFNEVSGAAGFYSVRFRPNSLGYWRVVISYAAGQQILAQTYSVTPDPQPTSGGLQASFTNC